MNDENTHKLTVYMKEYESIRSEIILRLKEKNTLVRYMIVLVSAIIVGLGKFQSNIEHMYLMYVLLIIVPVISILLTSIHDWHDRMIITLGAYIKNDLKPKINSIFDDSELLRWDEFLHKARNERGWDTKALIMRLIFIAPILLSLLGYFLITTRLEEKWIEILMVSIDVILLLCIFRNFIIIDRKYKESQK